ncbi:MarR family winged helix-turn-helix transcriptional regulator [Streptoalloteichus hindustanus]|uniref:DNA-binding transcriptional regulator, MarR family n=1 Tax=Streptoalloteichus hindustanus TaxID=2017 RepID=A0A1M4VKT7_STRHI|nr:MarR family transcriptional regulator [Streptoalloteichus hindustanus]SHE69641.1 DNA-binding transcriptional regulator, MarR family [Streptoalloteichus hindustanus]
MREGVNDAAGPGREGVERAKARPRSPFEDAVAAIIDQWRRERPDLDPSPIGVVGRLGRLTVLIDRGLAQNFARYDLTGWEFDVLAALRRSGDPFRLTVGRLQSTMMISSGTMTHRLDRLEKRGLVERAPDPADRRGVLVQLTHGGRELVDEVVGAHLDRERQLLAGLDGPGQDQLADLLRQLLVHLGDTPDAGQR